MNIWVATTLLLVKCGTTTPSVQLAHGDYDRWFLRALAPAGVALRVVEVHAGVPLPRDASGADGIVATGSPRSVLERAPWMAYAGAWLRERAERGVPVLGVCFGHQLLAQAYGGEVARSPRGREIGGIRCTLTPEGRADPLFDGIPARFDALATHEDEVVALPRGATVLAFNGWSRVQAFRVAGNVRGVQFHPELDPAAMAAIAAARAEALAVEARARGEDPRDAARTLAAGLRATPAGARILKNFAALCARAAAGAPATRPPSSSGPRA
jgi:GMP synthase (glutamine-hydrolysing)